MLFGRGEGEGDGWWEGLIWGGGGGGRGLEVRNGMAWGKVLGYLLGFFP